MSKLEDLVNAEHKEVLKTSLDDFLKEANDIGYSYFFKDIIKKSNHSKITKKGAT